MNLLPEDAALASGDVSDRLQRLSCSPWSRKPRPTADPLLAVEVPAPALWSFHVDAQDQFDSRRRIKV